MPDLVVSLVTFINIFSFAFIFLFAQDTGICSPIKQRISYLLFLLVLAALLFNGSLVCSNLICLIFWLQWTFEFVLHIDICSKD